MFSVAKREREENASSLSTPRNVFLLFREPVDGERLKEDTDAVLGLFLPLMERSPQAQFRYPRAVMRGPRFSASLHMLHHTSWV